MNAGCAGKTVRTCAIPERQDVFTIRRYTNPRSPLPLPYYVLTCLLRIENWSVWSTEHLAMSSFLSQFRAIRRSSSDPVFARCWRCYDTWTSAITAGAESGWSTAWDGNISANETSTDRDDEREKSDDRSSDSQRRRRGGNQQLSGGNRWVQKLRGRPQEGVENIDVAKRHVRLVQRKNRSLM